jgi:hypothetical protein
MLKWLLVSFKHLPALIFSPFKHFRAVLMIFATTTYQTFHAYSPLTSINNAIVQEKSLLMHQKLVILAFPLIKLNKQT